jgi:hypothetical protein
MGGFPRVHCLSSDCSGNAWSQRKHKRGARRLITPHTPAFSSLTGEKFEVWTRAARLDYFIQLIRLSRVLPLSAQNDVYLSSTESKGSKLAAGAKEDELRNVTEIEADAAPIRSPILAYFVPHYLISESPSLHDFKPFEDKSIGDPEIKITSRQREL